MARGEAAKVALEYLERYPTKGNSYLARILCETHPNLFQTKSKARDYVRYYRGKRTGQSKALTTHLFNDGPDKPESETPEMPKSQAEPWLPFTVAKPERVFVVSDIHVPYHDETALKAAVDFAGEKIEPTTVIINGDGLDFYSISRWEKRPDRRDLKSELEAAKELLVWLCFMFPNADIIFKLGNHEERWDKYVGSRAAEMYALPGLQIEQVLTRDDSCDPIKEIRRVEFVKDQRPVQVGKLPIFHGHELPGGFFNPVNMARGAFLRTIHTILVGHAHRSSSHTEPDMNHREITCWSQGCLCDFYPEYARINKWNHGFVEVQADPKSGEFSVKNYRIQQGRVRAS